MLPIDELLECGEEWDRAHKALLDYQSSHPENELTMHQFMMVEGLKNKRLEALHRYIQITNKMANVSVVS